MSNLSWGTATHFLGQFHFQVSEEEFERVAQDVTQVQRAAEELQSCEQEGLGPICQFHRAA